MSIVKTLAFALVGLAIGVGVNSAAFAKAHDKGVADGTPLAVSPGSLPPGFVAGRDVPGVGRDCEGCDPFRGVAADLELDVNYGQNVVSPKRGGNRVVPVEKPGLNK